MFESCESCQAERDRSYDESAERAWARIPAGERRWFDGCAFCAKPLGEHSDRCAFRAAARAK